MQGNETEIGRSAISVNGVVIHEDLISLEVQLQDAAAPTAAWENAVRALIVRQLLLSEAEARGIGGEAPEPGEDTEEAAIRRLLDEALNVPEPTEDELRRWYERNCERLRAPDVWRVQHLLLAADPKDERQRQAMKARAQTLLGDVLADPDGLTGLAQRLSDCPSKAQGGDLGWIARGSTVPEFESRLAALRPGEVCPSLVESRYGMHILRVLACKSGCVPPFDAVKARIAEFLQEASWRQGVQGFIASLAARARIEGFDLFEGENAPPRPSAWPAGSSCTGTPPSSGPQPGRKPMAAGADCGGKGCCG